MKTIRNICFSIIRSMLIIRKNGLYQYRNYLFNQLDFASGSGLRSSYKKYVEDQVALNDRQLARIEQKLATNR